MDRVNRRFLVASTLLAIPAALLMVSLSSGTPPTTQLAVGLDDGQTNVIQQVVGKQLESRNTRPGLLEVLSGSKPSGNQDHQHENMPRSESKGLLDALFDGKRTSSKSTHNHTSNSSSHNHTHKSSNSQPASTPSRTHAENGNVNWNGIPYHRVDGSTRTSGNVPIQDPGSAKKVADMGETRIIRGGSTRSIPASTVSTRLPSQPTLAQPPAKPLAVETPSEVYSAPRSARTFSTSSSSRRSDRRSVEAFDTSMSEEPAPEPQAAPPSPVVASPNEVADLVPRVARKEVREEPKKAAPPAQAKPVAAKPQPQPNQPTAPVAKQPAPTAVAADSATKLSTEAAEPESAGDVAMTAPSANLAAPTTIAQQPTYTTPVDPARTPVPSANIPPRAYAASTPSAPVSHRIGPPSNAFTGSPIASEPSQLPAPIQPGQSGGYPSSDAQAEFGLQAPEDPRLAPAPPLPPPAEEQLSANRSQLGAPMGAIGSGVAADDNRDPYQQRGGQPMYETAQRPTQPYLDPYARRDRGSAAAVPSLSTFGQPSSTSTAPTHPSQPASAVPMQPIHGYTAEASTPPSQIAAGDNFARSTYDSRNHMRGNQPRFDQLTAAAAATSELPGIRVITHGPSEIMIRQSSEYEIRVENRGSIDAHGVLVRALVPDWAEVRGQNATRGSVDNQVQGSTERLVWTIDHLPAGASEQMFVRLTAARSGTYNLDVDWTLLPQKSVAQVQVHEPRLNLTIEGPEEVVYGQSQTYKVRVLNPGDGTAPNVVFTLSPNSATPQTQRIGDIPPGKEAQFDVELTAQDLGDLKIHGLATGDLELRAESSKTIRVAAAQLEAILTGPELKYQNSDAMYNLQLLNEGAATSENVVATLRLPTGAKYLGGIEEAKLSGSLLKWEIAALAPGATRNYQFRCSMGATGEHLFAFDCKGTAAGTANVSIATRVESIADLVLSISDPPAPAPIGSDVVYEIIVRNRGSKEATDVRAIAQFSHGIEPRRVEGQSGEVSTGQVLFDPIPRIAAGQEVRLRVIAVADRAGHHRFRTEVRSGDTILVAEEATHYMSPQAERVSRRSSDVQAR